MITALAVIGGVGVLGLGGLVGIGAWLKSQQKQGKNPFE